MGLSVIGDTRSARNVCRVGLSGHSRLLFQSRRTPQPSSSHSAPRARLEDRVLLYETGYVPEDGDCEATSTSRKEFGHHYQ